jgi:outer membrane protein assembly factor BamB
MQACRLLVALALSLLIPAASTHAQNWPRFRGPNGSGLSPATIPAHWTEQNYLWKVRLPGVGHSSPVLWGQRLFVTCADTKGTRTILCVHPADGRQLWRRDFAGGKSPKHADNSFASATPAVDDRHLYVAFANPREYLVLALTHDGKEVWRTDLGPFRSGHGFGASPVVHEGVLAIANDQDGPGALLGLDRNTGKMLWKVPRKGRASYSTPCVYQPGGRPAELIFTNYEHGVTSIDPQSGRVNWEVDVFDKRHIETTIGSPIVTGDLILASCGWLGVRQEVVAIRPPLDGQGKVQKVYTVNRSAPLCTTPLVKDGLLFLWSDQGIVSCADARTGAVYWHERVPGSYYSSPICVGPYLGNVSREGEFVVLAAAKRYEQLAVNRLGEGSHATPAVAGGRLYVRTFSHLIAIGNQEPNKWRTPLPPLPGDWSCCRSEECVESNQSHSVIFASLLVLLRPVHADQHKPGSSACQSTDKQTRQPKSLRG